MRGSLRRNRLLDAQQSGEHPDLIWQQDGTNVPGVWYMGGADDGTFLSAKELSGPQPGWRIAGVGDLDRDGHPDLIWQQDGTNAPGFGIWAVLTAARS